MIKYRHGFKGLVLTYGAIKKWFEKKGGNASSVK